ncbi:MAG: enoyl-CoA hydratase/isomerase family protein [Haloarculaceae archaeon]
MPDEFDTVVAEPHPEDERVARVLIDRPSANNTLDLATLLDLGQAFTDADRDPDTQAILLGSTADPFCSGAELAELRDMAFEEGSRWLTAYLETIDVLRETGKPVVAAVGGTCVAGGNELVMGCDLIVAGESARFGQPEVGVGSTAAGGGLQMLPLVVGEKRARELLLTGRLLEAAEAERFGLVNRVVPDDAVEERALALLQEIVDTKSPQAYRAMKAVMSGWTNLAMLQREMARDMTARVWDSPEFRERADAFLAREEPDARPFTGARPPERE